MNTSNGKCKSTTHFACKERLDKYGGKTLGCCCVGHECSPPEESTLREELEKILNELALQLWGGQLGGDANDKAMEIFPWLEALIQERERLAVYDFHNYIMGKNIIQTETDQAFNYARLHKAIDEYIADLGKQAVKVKGDTK